MDTAQSIRPAVIPTGHRGPPRDDLDMPTLITVVLVLQDGHRAVTCYLLPRGDLDSSPEGMTHRAVTCYLLPPDALAMPEDDPPRGDLDMPTIITAVISPERMTHRAMTWSCRRMDGHRALTWSAAPCAVLC